MADQKRFYWLKLKKDFFKRHDMRIIEEMPNGKEYALFYLKLLCESIDHNGELRFSDHIPYSEDMLATITNTNVDIVRTAIKIMIELGMLELMDDGTIFMNKVENMIGSAVDNDNANRQRRYRERQKKALALQNVTELVTNNNESKSKNKNKSKSIEEHKGTLSSECPPTLSDKSKSIEDDTCQSSDGQVTGKCQSLDKLYQDLCPNLKPYNPAISYSSEAERLLKAIHNNRLTWDDIKKAFTMANESEFLQGKVTDWRADLKWLIKPENIQKVLDGNYTNRTNESKKESDIYEQTYSADLEQQILSRSRKGLGANND